MELISSDPSNIDLNVIPWEVFLICSRCGHVLLINFGGLARDRFTISFKTNLRNNVLIINYKVWQNSLTKYIISEVSKSKVRLILFKYPVNWSLITI